MNSSPTQSLKLSRSSSVPLWQQLETDLRRRLHAGEFVDHFPSDRELMEAYGVSRHTARHAMTSLGNDGIVHRFRGIGSSIDSGRIAQSLGSLYSLFQVVESAGIQQTSVVLSVGAATDPHIAPKLGLDESSLLFHLARLRLADGDPIAVDYVWLPGEYISPLQRTDFTRTSLYDEMELSTLGRPSAGSEHISAIVPNSEIQHLLSIDDQTGVFELIRQGEKSGNVIEFRRTFIRGDSFNLVTDWRRGQRREMRLEQKNRITDLAD